MLSSEENLIECDWRIVSGECLPRTGTLLGDLLRLGKCTVEEHDVLLRLEPCDVLLRFQVRLKASVVVQVFREERRHDGNLWAHREIHELVTAHFLHENCMWFRISDVRDRRFADVADEVRVLSRGFQNRVDEAGGCTLSLRSGDADDDRAGVFHGIQKNLRRTRELLCNARKFGTRRNTGGFNDDIERLEVCEPVCAELTPEFFRNIDSLVRIGDRNLSVFCILLQCLSSRTTFAAEAQNADVLAGEILNTHGLEKC